MQRDEQLLKAIRQHYPFHPTSIKWFNSLYASHVAAKVETRDGLYKVKRYNRTTSNLERLAKAHQWLYHQAPRELPVWHLTHAGEAFFECDGTRFYITDWVEGRAFNHTESDARALGKTLRHIHVPIDHQDVFQRPDFEKRLRPVVQARRILETKSFRNFPSGTRQFLRKELSTIRSRLDDAIRSLQQLKSDLQVTTIHGDVTVPNVLYTDTDARLIDWELLSAGYAAEELARSAMNTCNLSIDLIESLLDGYNFHQWGDAEKLAFRAFLHIPREIVYLLHRAAKSRPNEHDNASWQLVMQTWRDRMEVIRHYPL